MTEIVVNIQAQYTPPAFAEDPTPISFAEEALQTFGTGVQAKLEHSEAWNVKGWARKYSDATGEGFRDFILESRELDEKTGKPKYSHRFVVYGPGEHVQPHQHDRNESFNVLKGGCHLWQSTNGTEWSYSYCGGPNLLILPGTIHCLIAGSDGLVMEIENDTSRSTDFFTKDVTKSKDFKSLTKEDYNVTIQQLYAKTIEALAK